MARSHVMRHALAWVVGAILLGASCAPDGEPGAVLSELPPHLAERTVASGRMTSAPAREDRTDYFVLEGIGLEEALEHWMGCLGGGGEVSDLSTEEGRSIGRTVDGGFVAASEWGKFYQSDPIRAESLGVTAGDPADLWVVQISWLVVDAETCSDS